MATKLFLRYDANPTSDYTTGNNDANLRSTAIGWVPHALALTAGSSATTASTATVAGPTPGVETVGTTPRLWYSPPLAAAATISGSITWNIWAHEAAMANNVAINGRLEVIDGATGTITLIDQTTRTIEVGTASALNNFSETPGAGVACKKGDRLRVRIFGDDSIDGNMASGSTFTVTVNGPTGAANGDTWLQLTENLTFASEPAGSQVFLTDTASAVSTASVDREAWTSRGAGVQTDVRNTAAGWTAPLQFTDTAGGTVVDWFTRPLTAFTLGGAARVNARFHSSSSASNATIRCEIARVAADGTSPTAWAAATEGATSLATGVPTSEAVKSFLVSGDDLAISDGQRLRIRFLIDDIHAAMAASQTATLSYAGTSGGASGDTYVTFTQTLTESSSGTTVSADVAAVTAAALASSDHVKATSGVGTVTAAALDAVALPGARVTADVAAVSAAALGANARVVATSSTAATTAAGVGASDAIVATAAVSSVAAAGLDATVSVATATTVTAGAAATTATAYAANPLITSTAASAATTAEAYIAANAVKAAPGVAATTAAAYVAADLVAASSGLASASGAAPGALIAVRASTDVSAATAVSYGATTTTAATTTATADVATVAASAQAASAAIRAGAAVATSAAAGQDAAVSTSAGTTVTPGVAATTATAHDADMVPAQAVTAGLAAATAAGLDATALTSSGVTASASTAAVTAAALDATATGAAQTTVLASVAAVTTSASPVIGLVVTGAPVASVTAEGFQVAAQTSASVTATADVAATIAAAWGVSGSVIVGAVLASASAQGHAVAMAPRAQALAGVAATTGTAYGVLPRIGAQADAANASGGGRDIAGSVRFTSSYATALATAWDVDPGIGVRPDHATGAAVARTPSQAVYTGVLGTAEVQAVALAIIAGSSVGSALDGTREVMAASGVSSNDGHHASTGGPSSSGSTIPASVAGTSDPAGGIHG